MTAFTLHEKGFVMSPLRSFPSLLRFSALMYKEGGGVVVVVVVVGYASVLIVVTSSCTLTIARCTDIEHFGFFRDDTNNRQNDIIAKVTVTEVRVRLK